MFDEFDTSPFGLITTCLFVGGMYLFGKKNGRNEILNSYEKMENDKKMAEMQAQIFYLRKELHAQKGIEI